MRRLATVRALLALGCVPLTSGCVAALVPVLAAGAAVGRTAVQGSGDGAGRQRGAEDASRSAAVADRRVSVPPVRPMPIPRADPGRSAPPAVETLAGARPGSRAPDPRAAASAAITPAPADDPVGAGERALSAPALAALDRATAARAVGDTTAAPLTLMADYVRAQGAARAAGQEIRSAVLEKGVELTEPRFIPCDDRPLAAIIDLDADGADLKRPLDPTSVSVAATQATVALHSAGVQLLYLSDRPASQAAAMRQTLTRTGLYAEGDQLLLADGSRKQERRWAAARTNCVVALSGDERGDMDELYEYLRDPKAAHMLNGMWNAGWFLGPPPIQATAR